MNRSPILFRCDGTPETGWEPLHQSLVLAAALQRRRRGSYFLSRLEPAGLALPVQRAGNEWLAADAPVGSPEDLKQTLREARRLQAAAVVVNGPAPADYLAELSEAGLLVTAFDSTAGQRFPADLVINPLLGPPLEKYRFRPGCQLLVGARYALVRPLIRRLRPLRAQEPPTPFRALVAMGDDDQAGAAVERTKHLLEVARIDKVDVMVRTHHPGMTELKALVEAEPERVAVVTEPAELTTRLGRCHLAVTRGDGWSLELACLGVPQLILIQEDRHRPNAQQLVEEGAAVLVGDDAKVSPTALRQAAMQLLTNPLERHGMTRCGRQLIDGRGPDRMVNALEILLHPARPEAQRLAA